MIRIDRRIARAALKLSKRSYDAELRYDPSQKKLFLTRGLREVLDSVPVSVAPEEVTRSISRLLENGCFEKRSTFMGGFTFSVTPRLRHRFAFWLDAFSKKFWGGFVTGVLTAVTANLLTGYVQQLLSKLFQ